MTGDSGIGAIVVSHQNATTIDDCLARLRAAAGVAEIRVVDNGSRDGTVAIVQRHALADTRVRFVANPDNPGFAAACNQGADASEAFWLAFVNPDCLVQVDTLQRLCTHLGGHPDVGLLGADLVDEHGVRDGAARRHDPDFVAMLRSPAARDLSVAADDREAVQRVDAVSGALMVVGRALYRAVGGFDASYRLHAEDLDLCRRVRASGAAIAVANDVRVVHLRGVSSRSRPLFVEWHKHRGLWRYFRRFQAPAHGPMSRLAVAGSIAAHFTVVAARTLFR